MTNEKILEVLTLYQKLFEERGIPKVPSGHTKRAPEVIHQLAHCNNMLNRVETFCEERRLGKAFRWLGFIQGVLWSAGIYTLEELKSHNRPSSEAS